MSLCAEKCFSLSDSLAWAKKTALFRKPKGFCLQKALRFALKNLSFSQPKHRLFEPLFTVLKNRLFYVQKPFFCTSLSLLVSKTAHFHKPKALLLPKSFLIYYPKQPFSTLRFPFQRPLTYCLQRIQLFFWCSLNSLRCKAGTSHRFKSLPAIPGNIVAFRLAGYLMNTGYFSKNLVSTGDLNRPRSPEVRKPLVCFLVLFAQCKKNKPVPFPGTSEVLQTSNQPTAVTFSHRNN